MNGKSIGDDSALCFEIIKYIKQTKFDLIIIANYSTPTGMLAIEYLNLKKIPFIIEVDGGFFKNGKGLKEKLKKHLISSASYWLSSGKVSDEYLMFYGAIPQNIFRYPFTSLYDNDKNSVKTHSASDQMLRLISLKSLKQEESAWMAKVVLLIISPLNGSFHIINGNAYRYGSQIPDKGIYQQI